MVEWVSVYLRNINTRMVLENNEQHTRAWELACATMHRKPETTRSVDQREKGSGKGGDGGSYLLLLLTDSHPDNGMIR